MICDKHCFELYGYDIMIDDTLKPWLIEVNASPSLTANTREDYELKCRMLNDLFDVVDAEGKLRGDEEHVGGFDLIYDNGYVEIEAQDSCWSSYLGSQMPGGSTVPSSTSMTPSVAPNAIAPALLSHSTPKSNVAQNTQKSRPGSASSSVSSRRRNKSGV